MITVDSTVLFWDPCSGLQYKPSDNHPYRTLGCCFNQFDFLDNIQASDEVRGLSFQFKDKRAWKSMDPQVLTSLKPHSSYYDPLPLFNYHDTFNIIQVNEQEVIKTLKLYIESHRQENGSTCVWDTHLEHLLKSSIWSHEQSKLLGQPCPDFFQSSIRSYIPSGYSFRGVPIEFKHANPHKMFAELQKSKYSQLLDAYGDGVRFGLGLGVFEYANTIVCWVMLGVSFQPL